MCGGAVKSTLPGLRYTARAVAAIVAVFWGAIFAVASWWLFG